MDASATLAGVCRDRPDGWREKRRKNVTSKQDNIARQAASAALGKGHTKAAARALANLSPEAQQQVIASATRRNRSK